MSGIQDEKYELEQKDENFDDVMERSLSKGRYFLTSADCFALPMYIFRRKVKL